MWPLFYVFCFLVAAQSTGPGALNSASQWEQLACKAAPLCREKVELHDTPSPTSTFNNPQLKQGGRGRKFGPKDLESRSFWKCYRLWSIAKEGASKGFSHLLGNSSIHLCFSSGFAVFMLISFPRLCLISAKKIRLYAIFLRNFLFSYSVFCFTLVTQPFVNGYKKTESHLWQTDYQYGSLSRRSYTSPCSFPASSSTAAHAIGFLNHIHCRKTHWSDCQGQPGFLN